MTLKVTLTVQEILRLRSGFADPPKESLEDEQYEIEYRAWEQPEGSPCHIGLEFLPTSNLYNRRDLQYLIDKGLGKFTRDYIEFIFSNSAEHTTAKLLNGDAFIDAITE